MQVPADVVGGIVAALLYAKVIDKPPPLTT